MINYQYTYGPVSSWRLGSSLGIDPISQKEKICNFDCVYCQLGRTKEFARERREFLDVQDVTEEIRRVELPMAVDYITFSGAGEPTLAKNLGDMIQAVRGVRKEKIAVITNSSLISRKDVKEDLLMADFVLAKLDACDPALFQKVNRPMKNIKFEFLTNALKDFSVLYDGRFALQIMFTDVNKESAERIAELAGKISPDEIQINTPLRPCHVKALSPADLEAVETCFRRICRGRSEIVNVYKARRKSVTPVSQPDTLRRRGKNERKRWRDGEF